MSKTTIRQYLIPTCEGGVEHSPRRSLLGFTLAEVLITLGIIGVVASMTIPTLVTNYQDKVMVNKAKLAHSQLNNALKLYAATNDCYGDILCLFNTNKTSDEVAQDFSTVLKGSKVCNPNIVKSKRDKYCKDSIKIKDQKNPYKVDGAYEASDAIGIDGRIILSNGMIYKIAQRSSCYTEAEHVVRDEYGFDTGERSYYTSDSCAVIYIDTNGLTPPNQYGRDIFRYNISVTGQIISYGNMIDPILKENKLGKYVEYNLGDTVPGYVEE